MTDGQLLFAILAAITGGSGVVWTVSWALRQRKQSLEQWRQAGPVVTAESGLGRIDPTGNLHVFFRSGRSNLVQLQGPWLGNESVVPDEETDVHATFVRNQGRSAVTVQRSKFILADVENGPFHTIHPQPGSSPWGDLLPARLDSGQEIVLIHTRQGLPVYLTKVMRDADVSRGAYILALELGDGTEVLALPPVPVRPASSHAEVQEAIDDGLLEREEGGSNPWEHLP